MIQIKTDKPIPEQILCDYQMSTGFTGNQQLLTSKCFPSYCSLNIFVPLQFMLNPNLPEVVVCADVFRYFSETLMVWSGVL